MESLNFNKKSQNERASGQRKEFDELGHHFNTLYDKNEDESGEDKDLATGEKYVNDQDIEAIGVVQISEEDLTEEHPIIQGMQNDIAEKYLLENDPTYLGKGKWKEDDKKVA